MGLANQKGRFPANLLVSDNVLDDGKKHSGCGVGGRAKHGRGKGYGFKPQGDAAPNIPKDNGGYSRFFSLDAWADRNLPFLIVPKPSKKEREMGLKPAKNTHTTVKPVKLMAYLITMGSREGDVVLDPFAGSGTTAMAAKMLGRRFICMEKEEEYAEIAEKRMASVEAPKSMSVEVVEEKQKKPEPKAEQRPEVEIVEEMPVDHQQQHCPEYQRQGRQPCHADALERIGKLA